MLPENLYKRRRNHNNTPPSVLLLITNCVVLAVSIALFTSCSKVNNFFWAVMAVLLVYNIYTIRKNREEYNWLNIVVYVSSIAIMAFLFYYIRTQPGNC